MFCKFYQNRLFLFDLFQSFFNMSLNGTGKRKLHTRTITENYKILKEIHANMEFRNKRPDGLKKNLRFMMKYEKNTTTEKRQRMRSAASEDLDKACYKWLLNVRHQNMPVNGSMLKVKALYFKELGLSDTFQASDWWLDRWKKRFNVSFKTISGILSIMRS